MALAIRRNTVGPCKYTCAIVHDMLAPWNCHDMPSVRKSLHASALSFCAVVPNVAKTGRQCTELPRQDCVSAFKQRHSAARARANWY